MNSAKSYADSLASNYDAAGAAATALSTAESYTDSAISTEVTNRDAAIATSLSTAEAYTDTKISAVVNGAPALLDTLKELADAINDDPNIANTLTTAIGTKVSKAGDSMSGNLAMGGNKVTGLGTPSATGDAATKGYVDGLASNYDAAGAAATALSTAESYTDTQIASGNLTATPTYLALNVNSIAKNVAATVSTTASTDTTVYSWTTSQYSAAKFLVKIAAGSHTQVIEILATLDTSNNVHITEYAEVSTNGAMGTITISVTSGTATVVANTTNNATVNLFGTLLVA